MCDDPERTDYEALGWDPDETMHGYECATCGHPPTRRELDHGSCPHCARERAAERRAKREADFPSVSG